MDSDSSPSRKEYCNLEIVEPDTFYTPKKKNRGKKRRREDSESSTELLDELPENTLAVEKNLQASAIKNNLDDASVKKILKKVVTNDHVLALVKLREEEENAKQEESRLHPKLTRAKVKELMRVSPKSSAWNLEKLELTPIKHIPVKTRPEVTALIAQDLPEDEDDDEYQPTHDDAHSDDEQTDMSYTDVESQPRTPATPATPATPCAPKSPAPTDGPFKVPELKTPACRKLDIEEEATIALRTRSKLSLSETPIEHIESSFIPPDEVPLPDVDDLWNEFLEECLNPASNARNEDDDETDPEYNVAADPDANYENEEDLERSIIKISKKELNDLVTELFHIMPEDMTDNTVNTVVSVNSTVNTSITVTNHWEGKQEPLSDSETDKRREVNKRRNSANRAFLSIGKSETIDDDEGNDKDGNEKENRTDTVNESQTEGVDRQQPIQKNSKESSSPKTVVTQKEKLTPPKILRRVPKLIKEVMAEDNNVKLHKYEPPSDAEPVKMLPEQLLIMQQQLRQHIQLCATNSLQLYIHPLHWRFAHTYRECLETFEEMVDKNPISSANVCNLRPAIELVRCWERTVSRNTKENMAMVEFLQKEIEKSRRRAISNAGFKTEFHDTFKQTVANSSVFLYPYLLPPVPYRGDHLRKTGYLRSEDELIAIGLDQFTAYVDANQKIYDHYKKTVTNMGKRFGYSAAIDLMCKTMFPWTPVRGIHCHINRLRRVNDPDNPVTKYLATREITPVVHKLLPFNPTLTLYDHPEHEMPLTWVQYVAKTSQRAKRYLDKQRRKTYSIAPQEGVEVVVGSQENNITKNFAKCTMKLPLPYTKRRRRNNEPCETTTTNVTFTVATPIPQVDPSLYNVVESSTGAFIIPVTVLNKNTLTVAPLVTAPKETIANNLPEGTDVQTKDKETRVTVVEDHCSCCLALKGLKRTRQTTLREYFKPKKKFESKCPCSSMEYPKITERLVLLLNCYKSPHQIVWRTLNSKISQIVKNGNSCADGAKDNQEDLAIATSYQIKIASRTVISSDYLLRKRIQTIFSKFEPESETPVYLAKELSRALSKHLGDLYKEFATFLTAEQAEEVGLFADYFVQNCIPSLLNVIEEQVTNREDKLSLLCVLNTQLTDKLASSCELCTNLMEGASGYPTLVRIIFNMFPHKVKTRPVEEECIADNNSEKSDHVDEADKVNEETAIADYEADHSSDGSCEGGEGAASEEDEPMNNEDVRELTKEEILDDDIEPSTSNATNTEQLTVNKTELDNEESSEMSMMIMSEDEEIKTEFETWKKEEDKVILEVLKHSISLKDIDVVDMLEESLVNRSRYELEERVAYLLDMLSQSQL